MNPHPCVPLNDATAPLYRKLQRTKAKLRKCKDVEQVALLRVEVGGLTAKLWKHKKST